MIPEGTIRGPSVTSITANDDLIGKGFLRNFQAAFDGAGGNVCSGSGKFFNRCSE